MSQAAASGTRAQEDHDFWTSMLVGGARSLISNAALPWRTLHGGALIQAMLTASGALVSFGHYTDVQTDPTRTRDIAALIANNRTPHAKDIQINHRSFRGKDSVASDDHRLWGELASK